MVKIAPRLVSLELGRNSSYAIQANELVQILQVATNLEYLSISGFSYRYHFLSFFRKEKERI